MVVPSQGIQRNLAILSGTAKGSNKNSTPSSTYCCSSHTSTPETKYARIESYGSQKPFQMQESKKFLLCLFFRFFLSKYSTLNHSEAPCRKAKTRNYMNRTANITNPPTLLDRKACKGSPSERLVNTRILTLLSRNRNREHLSQQELNP